MKVKELLERHLRETIEALEYSKTRLLEHEAMVESSRACVAKSQIEIADIRSALKHFSGQ